MFLYLGIIAFIAVQGSNGQKSTNCLTASGSQGICIQLAQCSPILNLLSRIQTLPESAKATLKNTQCGLDGTTPKVCCPKTTQNVQIPTKHAAVNTDPPDVTRHPNLGLINSNICGPVTEPKIIRGNKTAVSEFPWMALISYTEEGQETFQCGGTVINKRYVLTAAHCVTGLRRGLKLSFVRLGEHDTSTEIDCTEQQPGVPPICADKYQDFLIENFQIHSDYDKDLLGSDSDIALIRLNRDADFSHLNVRPICLPVGNAATLKFDKGIVTGWGRTENRLPSNDLLKVSLGIVANNVCARVFVANNIAISHKQLCAGGTNGIDSCGGDSGGPLQYPAIIGGIPKYVQYGIVSFGTKNCAVEGYPGVYTRVIYFMDWILDNIKA